MHACGGARPGSMPRSSIDAGHRALEARANSASSARERISDSLLRDPKAFRDLLLLQVLAEVELDDLALATRQKRFVVEERPRHSHAVVETLEIFMVDAASLHTRELAFDVHADASARTT